MDWRTQVACCVLLWRGFLFSSQAQAAFGGEMQRWNLTNSASATVITLRSGISAGNMAVALFGFEAPKTMAVASASDSRGNSWTIQGSLLYNSVHQSAIASAYIKTALLVGDAITLNWRAPTPRAKQAGVIVYLTGCANATPDLNVTNSGYGGIVRASGSHQGAQRSPDRPGAN